MEETENKNTHKVAHRIAAKKPSRLLFWFRTLFLLAMFFAMCAAMIYTMEYIDNPESNVVVRKEGLTNQLSSIIHNGGDLDAVKHAYSTRNKEKRSFILHRDRGLFYPYDVALSTILNDLKCDYLATVPFVADSVYYSRLTLLIKENDYRNPFEQLDASQRYYFENIRAKAGNDYQILQSDVIKIADELKNKNQLVEKYLNKSTVSFIISVIALGLTLLLSGVQIWQNRKMRKLLHGAGERKETS